MVIIIHNKRQFPHLNLHFAKNYHKGSLLQQKTAGNKPVAGIKKCKNAIFAQNLNKCNHRKFSSIHNCPQLTPTPIDDLSQNVTLYQ